MASSYSIEVSRKTKKIWRSNIRKTAGPRAGCSGKGEWKLHRKTKAAPSPKKEKKQKDAA